MSQHDMNIANANGATVRADINAALAALASNSSGTAEPGTMFANQFWYDTTNNILKFRNEANDAWITFAKLDQSNNRIEQIYIGPGTVAAPGAAGSNDADSGIYFPSSNVVAIAAGGKDAARFNTATNAVNYLDVTPAATGAGPTVKPNSGTDTNIDLNIAGLGTGVVKAATAAADTNTTQLATTAFVLAQAASQAEQEAVGSSTKYVTPLRQGFHPSAAKGWVFADLGTTANAAFNVTSITDGGTGGMTVNWATDFSSGNYCALATSTGTGTDTRVNCQITGAGATVVQSRNGAGSNADPSIGYMVAAFGDE